MYRLIVLLLAALAACAGPSLGQRKPPPDPAAARTIEFTIPEAKEGEPYLRALVIGDWGTGRADQKEVAAAMIERHEASPLDLVLTTGDNFYPRGVQSGDDPMWETHFRQIYGETLRSVPWYPTLGNHDHLGKIQGQLDYAKRDATWKLPARYHTFSLKLGEDEVQFFALDTDTINDERDPQQLKWLEAELAKSNARWRIVYGHHPLYSRSVRGHNKRMIKQLEPLFTRYGVDLFFAGHDHVLEMLKPVKGVHYVVSGAAAGTDKAYAVFWTDEVHYASTGGGFVILRIGKGEVVVEFVRTDGATQYAYTVSKAKAEVR